MTDEQVRILSGIPILIVVGDYLGDAPSARCDYEIGKLEEAGGDVTFISLPEIGMDGNSHMLMQDRNNLEVADILIDWVSEHVDN